MPCTFLRENFSNCVFFLHLKLLFLQNIGNSCFDVVTDVEIHGVIHPNFQNFTNMLDFITEAAI